MYKIKFLALFYILQVLCSSMKAQDILFDWKYNIGNSYPNEGKCIAVDKDGFVYAGGTISGTVNFIDTAITGGSQDHPHSYLAKLTPEGNRVWIKMFRGPDCRITSVCFDHDNNLYVTGTYYNWVCFDTCLHTNNLDTVYNWQNMFIAKYNTAGQMAWVRNTTGAWYDPGYGGIKKLTVDTDNNLIVTGRCLEAMQYFDTTATYTTNDSVWVTYPNGHWENFYKMVGFIAKYNSNGQKLWAKSYGGYYLEPYSVATDRNNNIITTGIFTYPATFDSITITPLGTTCNFLAKFNANGKALWVERNGGGDNWNYSFDIATDSMNNIYETGSLGGGNVSFNDSIYFTGSGTDAFLTKFDSIGKVIWVMLIGTAHITSDIHNNFGNSIILKDSFLYLAGFFDDSLNFNGTILQTNNGGIFLLKMDLNSNVIRVAQYLDYDYSWSPDISLDSAGNIYITGTMDDVGNYNRNIFLAKIAYDIPVSVNNIPVNINVIEVYPNPFTDIINIFNKNRNRTLSEIEIFNSVGIVIFKEKMYDSFQQLNLQVLPAGLYFARISGEIIDYTVKLIKLK